jgi:hypothetical protein
VTTLARGGTAGGFGVEVARGVTVIGLRVEVAVGAGVSVGGTGVAVGTAVFVGGTGVAVGGNGVAVGTAVFVGGTAVAVGGCVGMEVGGGGGVGELQAANKPSMIQPVKITRTDGRRMKRYMTLLSAEVFPRSLFPHFIMLLFDGHGVDFTTIFTTLG